MKRPGKNYAKMRRQANWFTKADIQRRILRLGAHDDGKRAVTKYLARPMVRKVMLGDGS